MNNPTVVWQLAHAKLDDLQRDLDRPHPRPSRLGFGVRLMNVRLPRRRPEATTAPAPAGCTTSPVACAA